MVALREIKDGEELCISYILSDADLQVRQEALANYGFQCKCTKCLCEGGEEALINKTLDDVDQINDSMFGSDDESNVDDLKENDDSSFTEMSLAERVKELDAMKAKSLLGAIPIPILAPVISFVNQLGTLILKDLASQGKSKSTSELFQSMDDVLEFVKERNFVELCEVATKGEALTLSKLHKSKRWPSAIIREAHGCFSVVSAICFAQSGNFLPAMQMLDKALIFGLPRDRIPKFFEYVEFHSSQINNLHRIYCSVPRLTVKDYSQTRYQLEAYKVGLLRPIQFPVHESSKSQLWPSIQLRSKSVVVRKFALWPAKEKWR